MVPDDDLGIVGLADEEIHAVHREESASGRLAGPRAPDGPAPPELGELDALLARAREAGPVRAGIGVVVRDGLRPRGERDPPFD